MDHDVTILQGVTLGGTGKERGNRHPKVARGAVLQQSCSVLGNIKVGEGAIITAKSIVTKNVPALARVSGIPGKVKSFVNGSASGEESKSSSINGKKIFEDTEESTELERRLMNAYLKFWNQSNQIVNLII